LKELIVYDFKFPMERRDLTRQLRYLDSLFVRPVQLSTRAVRAAAAVQELEKTNWVWQTPPSSPNN